MNTKTVFGIYLAWDYDREEDVINDMSKNGWQLRKGGLVHHTYERSDITYRYKLDFNARVKVNFEDYRRYISLFEEQGWELVNSTINGWHYFRKPYVEEADEEQYELYTDNTSLIDMLNRWNFIARIFQVVFAVFFILDISHFIFNRSVLQFLGALSFLFTFSLFQVGINSMKRKRINEKARSYKGINISYLLLLGMVITLILIIVSVGRYPYFYKERVSFILSEEIDEFSDNITIKEDGLYYIDFKSTNKKGIVKVQLMMDNTVVYNNGGANFSSNSKINLKKGEYELVARYYLDNLDNDFLSPIESDIALDNKSKDSKAKVFIGIR